MSSKKLLGAVALSAVLAGGGVAGALLGTPSLSSAQTPTNTTQVGGHPRELPALDAAATALGISADELRAELQSDKTIAQVASEKGIGVDTVIDAMVAAQTATLEEHVTDFVHNGRPDGGFGHGPGRDRGENLDAVVTVLGITVEELRTELQAGKTIAEVASDKGVDVQAVIDALIVDENAKIDQALADGSITQERAEEMRARVTQRATDAVNNDHPFRGRGHGGPGGPHDDPEAN